MSLDFAAALKEEPEPQLQEAPPPASFGDVESVKRGLSKYDAMIDQMVEQGKNLTVNDEASNVAAIELAGDSKKLNKAIEDFRKNSVQPALEYQRAINNLCKHYQDRLSVIERDAKTKCGQYQAKVELERRKAQEAARKAQEELQKKIEAEAKAANVEPPPVVAPVIPEAPKTVRTEKGSMTFKEVWKFEVVNAVEVPREYLVVSDSLIREAVKNGIRQIPGVNIYSEKEASIRA